MISLGSITLVLAVAVLLAVPVVLGLLGYLVYHVARGPHREPEGRADAAARGLAREGDAPAREGDAPAHEGNAPAREGEATTAGPRGADGVLSVQLRRLVDALIAAALVLAGLAGILVGALLYDLGDRERIAELVAEGTIESDVFTEADLVELLHALLVWGGAGFAAAGGLVLAGGLAAAAYRIWLDRREAAGEPATPGLASNGLIGAVVAVVTSIVPFSPVIGGAVAGYLQGAGEIGGLYAGVVAGILLGVPTTVLFGAIAIGLMDAGLMLLGAVTLVGLVVTLVFEVGLCAIGGYAGGYLVTRRRT